VGPGDVFVALPGEKSDGHRYVGAALDAGARAVIVARDKVHDIEERARTALLVVDDPLAAVQRAAHAYRLRRDICVIAITGSSGKTTTKEMVTSILSKEKKVMSSPGNWNNHIGCPLSILALTDETEVAVLEMGANHVGEISLLSRIAEPDIAIVTTIGHSHVGLFGGLHRTAQAKFEIVEGLREPGGHLIVNGDNEMCMQRAGDLPHIEKSVFGFAPHCTTRATAYTHDARFHTHFTVDGCPYDLQTVGTPSVYNALAAIATGRRFSLSHAHMADVLRSFRPDADRGRYVTKHDVRFICDYYNANPEAMRYALEILAIYEPDWHKRVCVLGDMRELGEQSGQLHRDIGSELVRIGVRECIVVGEQARAIAERVLEEAMAQEHVWNADTADEAVTMLKQCMRPGDCVLIKGSRGVHLENVFEKV
jgi:UDP-N-acetylmuramoyl-tripeptide--D-alanyl-D-alanine ligase